MNADELKKEAEEKYNKRLKQNGYKVEYRNETYIDGYVDSAEPREKQIEIDTEQIRALQKQNGELTDKVKELEQELIEADNATDVFNAQEKRIAELEAQIEKMKCCENCAFFKDKTYDICNRIKKLGTRKCAFYKMF